MLARPAIAAQIIAICGHLDDASIAAITATGYRLSSQSPRRAAARHNACAIGFAPAAVRGVGVGL